MYCAVFLVELLERFADFVVRLETPDFPADLLPVFRVDFAAFLVDFAPFRVVFAPFLVDFAAFLVDFAAFLEDFAAFLVAITTS